MSNHYGDSSVNSIYLTPLEEDVGRLIKFATALVAGIRALNGLASRRSTTHDWQDNGRGIIAFAIHL
jgi:hypothetical protein